MPLLYMIKVWRADLRCIGRRRLRLEHQSKSKISCQALILVKNRGFRDCRLLGVEDGVGTYYAKLKEY